MEEHFVELKTYTNYTAEETETICKASPAVKNYISVQKRTASTYKDKIRLQRNNYWLNCAFATFFKSYSTEEVCKYWSYKTDLIIQDAWRHIAEGRHDDLLILAMGKLGTLELNLSSDIDLILLSSNLADHDLIKKIRKFIQLLSEYTEFGFCYRVDINLRPGGRLGPMVSSFIQLEDYLWSQGQTWERTAYVRSRILTGLKEDQCTLKQMIQSFVYRKFLDYRLLNDFKKIRSRIQESIIDSNSINLKLDKGAIRDIELFINSLQVIHGGKLKQLQTSNTQHAFEALSSLDLFDTESLKKLQGLYWDLRHIENFVQLINDQQTHIASDQTFKALEINKSDLLMRFEEADKIVSEIIGGVNYIKNSLPDSIEQQLIWLEGLGFDKRRVSETWDQLVKLNSFDNISVHNEELRKEFLYQFITKLNQQNLDKNLGLELLLQFIKSIRAKSSFFTLLLREKNLMNDLVTLFSSSPYLGGIISSRPELLDSFIFRVQETIYNSYDELLEALTEQKLLSEVISSIEFLQNKNVNELNINCTYTADYIAQKLLENINYEYSRNNLTILALGKWGSKELGIQSDLDFILVAKEIPTPEDYKIARRLISRLTEQHRGGEIYKVDLRLRPSGNSGPLIVTYEKLLAFIGHTAEPWQRQAYLKSRFLNLDFQNIYSKCIKSKLSLDNLSKLREVREKLHTQNCKGPQDLKYAWGGLVHIEFSIQIKILKNQILIKSPNIESMINHLAEVDHKWNKYSSRLIHIYNFLRVQEQFFRITASRSVSFLNANSEPFYRCSQLQNLTPQALSNTISKYLEEAREILNYLDPTLAES